MTKNKKNSWIKNVADKYTPVGVYKGIKDYRKAKKGKDASITESAQQDYKKKYGERMKPSYLKNSIEGFGTKKTRDYLKMKKKVKKNIFK